MLWCTIFSRKEMEERFKLDFWGEGIMINAFVVRKPQFLGHIMASMTNLSSDPNHNIIYSQCFSSLKFPLLNSFAWISASIKIIFAQSSKVLKCSLKKRFCLAFTHLHCSLSQLFYQDVFEQLLFKFQMDWELR